MKLFWKLFTTLGIVMALGMLAAVSMGWQVGRLAFQQFLDFSFENREKVLNEASIELNRGGRASLTSWLSQHKTPVPGRVLFIIDDSGADLLGRQLPPDLSYFLTQLQSGDGRRDRRDSDYSAFRNRQGPRYTPDLLKDPNTLETFRPFFWRTDITLANILKMPATRVGVVTLAIIMASITALLLAKSFSSPILRLQRATRGLASGELDTRVGKPFTSRKDEVGTLARDFDAMAERIQALITDKEVLLRDVSHELRSPLARIRVALALAERKVSDSARVDLERIDQETERLDQLVGQILTLARLRSSALESYVPVDLNHVITEVVADARFEHPNLKIDYEPRDVPTIQGNASELTSAIENVLRNALIHTGESAAVDVELEPVGSEVVITISDNGPGVPEKDLKRLFEPFYRVDPSRDHKKTGYGLGLAIAASIVERHGGTVEASNRPGGGLSVKYRLPASRGLHA